MISKEKIVKPSQTLTLTGSHVSDGDAADLRVAEAQQKGSVGPLVQDHVQVLLPDEPKYQSGGGRTHTACII